jgi:hypothetical protein
MTAIELASLIALFIPLTILMARTLPRPGQRIARPIPVPRRTPYSLAVIRRRR